MCRWDHTYRTSWPNWFRSSSRRADLSGAWSRRITDEHRLVYLVQDDDLVILSARYRYSK